MPRSGSAPDDAERMIRIAGRQQQRAITVAHQRFQGTVARLIDGGKITQAEVARRLHVSRETVRLWCLGARGGSGVWRPDGDDR